MQNNTYPLIQWIRRYIFLREKIPVQLSLCRSWHVYNTQSTGQGDIQRMIMLPPEVRAQLINLTGRLTQPGHSCEWGQAQGFRLPRLCPAESSLNLVLLVHGACSHCTHQNWVSCLNNNFLFVWLRQYPENFLLWLSPEHPLVWVYILLLVLHFHVLSFCCHVFLEPLDKISLYTMVYLNSAVTRKLVHTAFTSLHFSVPITNLQIISHFKMWTSFQSAMLACSAVY